MNYLQDLIKRVKADWKEWTTYQKVSWVERFRQRRAKRDAIRDRRMIESAIERAQIKNAKDGRTYYIMRSVTGEINELCSKDIHLLTRLKLLPRMNYLQRLEATIAIVTGNKMTQLNFDRIQANKNKKRTNEREHQGKDSK